MRHPIRRSRSLLFLILAAVLVLQALPFSLIAQETEPAQEQPGDELLPAFAPGQLIIAFQPWVTEDEITEFYEEYDLTHMENLDPAAPEDSAALVLAFVPADVTPSLVDTMERDRARPLRGAQLHPADRGRAGRSRLGEAVGSEQYRPDRRDGRRGH